MDISQLKKLAGISIAGVTNDNKLDIIIQAIKTGNSDVKQLAKQLNLTDFQLSELMNNLLVALIKGIGKHNNVPDSKFNQTELELGVKVEKEHTNDGYVAKMIAKDHLSELPDYYTRLKKMEDQ